MREGWGRGEKREGRGADNVSHLDKKKVVVSYLKHKNKCSPKCTFLSVILNMIV